MRKVLILTKQIEAGEELVRLLDELGVSVKLVSDPESAMDWMGQRAFDLFISDEGFSKEQLTQFGMALWSENVSALAYVTSFAGELEQTAAFYKVLGYHPVTLTELKETLSALQPEVAASESTENFPVLVVEDLDSPRDIICIFIESLGFPEVKGVASANEALKILEEDPSHYRCVVTDIRMPKISGKELIEIIRSHDRLQHLPVIVLTAFGTLDMLVDCLRLGASGFLIKPPKKEDMTRELSRAIRIHQKKEHPRLASHQEAEYIRKMVEEQKVT